MVSSRLHSDCPKPAVEPKLPSFRDEEDLPSDSRSFLEKYDISRAKIEEEDDIVITNNLLRDRNRRSRHQGAWYHDEKLTTNVFNAF